MRFRVDAQLPKSFAALLVARGHDADHVADFGYLAADDSDIWNLAISVGATIVTKDEDFAQRRSVVAGPQIVWLRIGNLRRAALLAWFPRALPVIVIALQRGDVIIEVREGGEAL